MGFFSKKTCAVCGCDLNAVVLTGMSWGGSNSYPIANKEKCCFNCFKDTEIKGINATNTLKTMSAEEIKHIIDAHIRENNNDECFETTKQIAHFIRIDEKNRKWCVPKNDKKDRCAANLYSYEDIISFELLEDGNTITQGGAGDAVAGALLFGGVGAVIGGTTGKKVSKTQCTSLRVKITLNSMSNPTEYINIITKKTMKGDSTYKLLERQAQEIVSIFQVICESNKPTISTVEKQAESSEADELMKYKQLLDCGAITTEEYEIKKKQLIGL